MSGGFCTGSEDILWVYGSLAQWQEELQAGERGRACAQLLGLGCLAVVAAPGATWPHPRSALGSLCFEVFPFAPCDVE